MQKQCLKLINKDFFFITVKDCTDQLEMYINQNATFKLPFNNDHVAIRTNNVHTCSHCNYTPWREL